MSRDDLASADMNLGRSESMMGIDWLIIQAVRLQMDGPRDIALRFAG